LPQGLIYFTAIYPEAPPWPTEEYRIAIAKTNMINTSISLGTKIPLTSAENF